MKPLLVFPLLLLFTACLPSQAPYSRGGQATVSFDDENLASGGGPSEGENDEDQVDNPGKARNLARADFPDYLPMAMRTIGNPSGDGISGTVAKLSLRIPRDLAPDATQVVVVGWGPFEGRDEFTHSSDHLPRLRCPHILSSIPSSYIVNGRVPRVAQDFVIPAGNSDEIQFPLSTSNDPVEYIGDSDFDRDQTDEAFPLIPNKYYVLAFCVGKPHPSIANQMQWAHQHTSVLLPHNMENQSPSVSGSARLDLMHIGVFHGFSAGDVRAENCNGGDPRSRRFAFALPSQSSPGQSPAWTRPPLPWAANGFDLNNPAERSQALQLRYATDNVSTQLEFFPAPGGGTLFTGQGQYNSNFSTYVFSRTVTDAIINALRSGNPYTMPHHAENNPPPDTTPRTTPRPSNTSQPQPPNSDIRNFSGSGAIGGNQFRLATELVIRGKVPSNNGFQNYVSSLSMEEFLNLADPAIATVTREYFIRGERTLYGCSASVPTRGANDPL